MTHEEILAHLQSCRQCRREYAASLRRHGRGRRMTREQARRTALARWRKNPPKP